MKNINIELTDAEYKALAKISLSPEDWANNVVKDRCRIAIDSIVNELFQKSMNGEIPPLVGTKEEIILAAEFKSAKEIMDELDASSS